MDKRAALEVVARLRQRVEARGIRPQKVILYGSYADGTHREGSDIDVVIISEDFVGKDYWERIEILADAIYEVFAPIEAVAMTVEEWERGDPQVAAFARKARSSTPPERIPASTVADSSRPRPRAHHARHPRGRRDASSAGGDVARTGDECPGQDWRPYPGGEIRKTPRSSHAKPPPKAATG